MKRIYYSGGSILTGDAIAEALLAYAEALAKSPRADIVHIPVVADDVTAADVGNASILIGPASQLMCVPERMVGIAEPRDAAIVAELNRRSMLIGSPRPLTQAAPESETADRDDY